MPMSMPISMPMPPQTKSAQSTLVLGLGATGYSVVAHLCARGDAVTVADSRDIAPHLANVRDHYPQVEVISGRLPFESLSKFDRVVVSPGIALPDNIGDNGEVSLIGDIELFVETARAPIIAITGSNGKSTVATLAGKLLEAADFEVLVGGNIGTPALELLTQPPPDFYVLELSSFQLETTHHLRTVAAAVLNISEDHMDRYRNLAEYAAAKARILRNAKVCVLNRDDAASAELLRANPNAITFGLDRANGGNYGLVENYLCRGDTRLLRDDEMTVHGAHNIANILAAFALVECAGAPLTQKMIAAAAAWRGLEHRCELAARFDGITWVNDSKATNVGATLAAICGFGDGLILIAGGVGKGADFSPLCDAVRAQVADVVLFGQDAPLIADALADCATIHHARDLQHAVSLAAECAKGMTKTRAATILFSPACASFDAFENYQQRGRAFKQAVAQLGAGA